MKPFFKSPKLSESCNSRNRFLRVADILEEEEEEEEEEEDSVMAEIGDRFDESSTIQCLSPRRIIARFVASFRRQRERKEVKELNREKEKLADDRFISIGCSRNGVDGGTSSSSSTESVEPGLRRKEKDTLFNLGVGCSLLYLVLASKDELSKMVDLRKQMESFLLYFKDELQRKDNLFDPFHSNTDMACSSTDFREGPCSTSQISYQQDFSSQILSDSQSVVPNHSMRPCLLEQDRREDGIDDLEAEFEAELELLQLHFEVGGSSKRTKRREQLRLKTAKNSNSTRSCCMSSRGEVIDPQEGDNHGVSPVELERRLHELLEARQQEQINELEGALECAKQEVIEKESEISWWKETAKVISQHVPAHSRLRLVSQHDRLFK